ncbi:MAG: exopolyphosphatase [Thiobacillaceae bacterium]|nr:exopolyphosphatase [Thiobacillaceae bacterium]MDW8323342.1 exopolyphosphatase [Burkholderiales bacterium]
MQAHPTLAAVDLGSNSFHLQVARVEGEQLFYLDAHKEPVRLAAGLTADKRLDEASQARALACLARFGERLKGMPAGAVRAVGTSALRVAKNAGEFMTRARAALGFDIEVVSGREEARLIYLGVAHSLPLAQHTRLVVDIGGGSTECILGVGYEPRERESLRMGCVVYTQRFFPDGRLDRTRLREAETAARLEIQTAAYGLRRGGWQEAVGSSGTARAIAEILRLNERGDGRITATGLEWLRERLVRAGHIDALELDGLKADRRPVIAGGVAILYAVFQEFGLTRMTVAKGAMREGILWDLLGRVHDRDMRDVTVSQFMRRYHVDGPQARRVERLALELAAGLRSAGVRLDEEAMHLLGWAARLHEVGISIAHSGVHKHSAYILENADMPGFSRQDQVRLARLARASRGGLNKAGLAADDPLWPLVLCLRLAVVFNISRTDNRPEELRLVVEDGSCTLRLKRAWLQSNPLTQAALEAELREWAEVSAWIGLIRLQAV